MIERGSLSPRAIVVAHISENKAYELLCFADSLCMAALCISVTPAGFVKRAPGVREGMFSGL